jgi:predicted outer membrane repeat protein
MHARWVRLAPLVTLLLGGRAWAATTVIAPGADLQAAVDGATDGDTLVLRPGEYTACLSVGPRIQLVGSNPETTLITCSNSDAPTLRFHENLADEGKPSVVAGVTLRHTAGNRGLELTNSHLIVARSILADFEGQGAVRAADDSAILFDGVQFLRNSSDQGGGALLVDGAYAYAFGCTFDGNESTNGGAVRLLGPTASGEKGSFAFIATQTTFSGNSALEGGGAVAAEGRGYLSLYQNHWEANTAEVGGAVSAITGNIPLFSQGNTWKANAATKAGGAVYLPGLADVTAVGTVFANDHFLENTAGDTGGALHMAGHYVRTQGCQFEANEAGHGGAVAVWVSNYLSSGDQFIGNVASDLGGAVYVQDVQGYSDLLGWAPVAFEEGRFEGNSARQGGAIAARMSPMRILRSTFEANEAAEHGGAVSAGAGSDVSASGSTDIYQTVFDANLAEAGDGGAVDVRSGNYLNLYDSRFGNNSAAHRGGGIASENSGISIQKSEFFDHEAEMGGAISSIASPDYPYEPSFSASLTRFENNVATAQGGAFHAQRATAYSYDSWWAHNEAPSGGAIAVRDSSTLGLFGSLFCANTATTARGGALETIAVGYGSYLNNLWIQNVAEEDGAAAAEGALEANGGESRWYGNTFLLNKVNTEQRGVLYAAKHLAIVEDSLFDSNLAGLMSSPDESRDAFKYTGVIAEPAEVAVVYNNPDRFGAFNNIQGDTRLTGYTTDNCFDDRPRQSTRGGTPDYGYLGDGVGVEAVGANYQYVVRDLDADGKTVLEGDCADNLDYDPDAKNIARGNEELHGNAADEDCSMGASFDADGDGHHGEVLAYYSRSPAPIDCDDSRADVFAGAVETYYDGINGDCAPVSDLSLGGFWAGDEDQDADGVPKEGDCDDTDATVRGGEHEIPAGFDIPWDGIDQDCSGADWDDLDGDSFFVGSGEQRDCDDWRADVYPGATDVWYDGIDSNCDGASDFDQDGDGFDAEGQGGLDCNDQNTDIYPGLPDCYPGDSDGDGIPDYLESAEDTDGDGLPDYLDPDSDNDGVADGREGDGDDDGDGIPNKLDNGSTGSTPEEPPAFPEVGCQTSGGAGSLGAALIALLGLRRRQPLRKK